MLRWMMVAGLIAGFASAAFAQGKEPEGVGGMRLGMTEQELASSGVATRVVPSRYAKFESDRVPFYWMPVTIAGETWGAVATFRNGVLQWISIQNYLAYKVDTADDVDDKVLSISSSYLSTDADCDRKMDEVAVEVAKRYKRFDGPPKVKHMQIGYGSGETTIREATITFPTKVVSLSGSRTAERRGCDLMLNLSLKTAQPASLQ